MAGKRSHGEGTIHQLPSGKWRGLVMDGYTNTGKKKMVSFICETKKQVVEKIRDYKTQQSQGMKINENYEFSEWADKWYESYKGQVQPSTYSNYRYTLNILKRLFGNIPIKDILPMQIAHLLNKLYREGYSKSQITKCRAMLIQIFDAAESNMLTIHNPARKAKPIKDISDFDYNNNYDKDAFSQDEIKTLFEKLPNNLIGHSIRLLLSTGMRVQELLVLAPDDISIDGSVININKAVKTVDGKAMMGPPKSRRSIRSIPVPPECQSSALFLRENARGIFVWSTSIQHPIYSVGSFRSKYYNTLKEIPEVRLLSPHCCRHTYITMLQAKGISMETIARLVGHAKISTTDGYLHVSIDTLSNAVNELNNEFIKFSEE
jgi:integrase